MNKIQYKTRYYSKFGEFILYSDGKYLTKIELKDKNETFLFEQNKPKVLEKAKLWLDEYFDGKNPPVDNRELNPIGTPFQKSIWEILLTVPYGTVISYGEIGEILKNKTEKPVSNRAIGNAIGKNPLPIFIPCHRVIGKNKHLTGYSLGLKLKKELLELEGLKNNIDFIGIK